MKTRKIVQYSTTRSQMMFTKTTEETYEKKNRSEDEHTAVVFARMMMEGKVRSAMRWLTSRSGGGLLHPNDEVIDSTTKTRKLVIDILKEKHPVAKQSKEEARKKVDNLPELETVTITSS